MKRHTSIAAWIFTFVLLSAASNWAQVPTSGLVLRLEGDSGVEKALSVPAGNGDPVVRWLDQSSAANHVVTNAPVATDTPTYRTGIANGHAAVEFGIDRDTERLQASTPLLTGTTDFSIFAVVRMISPYTGGARYITGNYGAANNGLEFYINNSKLAFYDNGSYFEGSALLSGDTWYLVEMQKSGNNYSLRLNDGSNGSTTFVGLSIPGSRNWTVGNGPDYNSEALWGNIAAVLVYNTALSAEDHQSVITYLGNTYAVPEPTAMALMTMASLLVWRKIRNPKSEIRNKSE